MLARGNQKPEPKAKSYFNRAQHNQLRWNRRLAEDPTFDPEIVMVMGDGPIPCDVMFIGERPGVDEPWGEPPVPFVGAAGMELNRYLRMAGLSRDQVYVTNLVKTYRDADPEEWEIVRDEDELRNEIATVQPRVIVPLGAFATKHLLGEWATMDVVSGVPTRAKDAAYIIIPIIHPAAGLHSVDSMPAIVEGFSRLRAYLSGHIAVPENKHPNPWYWEYRQGGMIIQDDPFIAIDTEGWRQNPWCLTASTMPGVATLVRPKNSKEFNDALRRVNSKVLLHNSMHDLDVLHALNIDIPDGGFIDTMVLAYNLCVEPQGLKALSYRYLGKLRDSYDEIVEPHNRVKAEQYIRLAATMEWPDSEQYVTVKPEKGKGLVAKVHKPHPMNRKLRDAVRDINTKQIDVRARWNAWKKDTPWVVEPVEEALGEMPVADLGDVDPQVALEYACADADDTLQIYPHLWQRIEEMGLVELTRIDHSIIPMVNWMQRTGLYVGDRGLGHLQRLRTQMEREMGEIQNEIKRITGAWINPDSSDQTAELLFGQLGLPWTKVTKSKSRPKCDDKVLEGLRGTHPVVSLVTDYRERSKIRGSFCIPITRAVLASGDGRCRCRVRVTRVSSGRLSATDPNLLAIPVRSKLGLEVRNGFSATPGRRLGTRDLDQIEMREMAHQSMDPRLISIFNSGKDVHRETGATVFGRKPNEVTGFQRYAAKRCGFGVITGITGAGLYDQIQMALALLPEEERAKQEAWDEVKCDKIITEWFAMYPNVRKYMEDCRCEARRYGYVRDRWGRIRYLPAIHSPIRHVKEEAERQSHSFKISASAQGTMKIWMANIWADLRQYWGVVMDPLLQVHDELMKECNPGWEDVIDESEVRCLNDPRLEMVVPVKSKGVWGDTWGSLEK